MRRARLLSAVIPAKAGIQATGVPGANRTTRMSKSPCVYILASRRNGTLYVGVTSDLSARMFDHRHKLREGFSARHGVDRLVYFEAHETMPAAIRREKQIKEWKRLWKLRIIEASNPDWLDLYDEATGVVRDAPCDRDRLDR